MEKGARKGEGMEEAGEKEWRGRERRGKTGKPAGKRRRNGEGGAGMTEAAWAADQSSPGPLLQKALISDFTVHSFISKPFLQEGQCQEQPP